MKVVIEELKSTQEKYCKRPCHVKQYRNKRIRGNKPNSDDLENFLVSYQIKPPPSVNGQRKEMPLKTVNTEYLIVGWMSLKCNVGGMTGLFVGFSFMGMYESFLVQLTKFLKWINRPKSNQEGAEKEKRQPIQDKHFKNVTSSRMRDLKTK